MSLSKWKRIGFSAQVEALALDRCMKSSRIGTGGKTEHMNNELGLCGCKVCRSSLFLAKQERIYGKLEEREGIVQKSRNGNGLVKRTKMARQHQGPHEVSGHEYKVFSPHQCPAAGVQGQIR